MKIAFYGAGGPVASFGIKCLEADHDLLLTDIIDLDTPHPTMKVDVGVPEQVEAAAAGMDCLINCTVLRPDPYGAFDVNLRGAYNILRAAVKCGVPRVIQTGPASNLSSRLSYWQDWDVTEEAPPRPGLNLYAVSKHMGDEVVKVFGQRHPELTILTLHIVGFYNEVPADARWTPQFAITGPDMGEAFRCAAEVPREKLPSNQEKFHISADFPHQRICIDKARRLLGWEPKENFAHLWSRKARAAWEAEHPEAQG